MNNLAVTGDSDCSLSLGSRVTLDIAPPIVTQQLTISRPVEVLMLEG